MQNAVTVSVSGPLQIQSVVDQVYAAVRARIQSGDLARGSRLRQAALAEELGVSRTPLREALRRLATEGLVEFEPNRGATVAVHDFADQQSSWLARIALEPGAARLAAERRDPASIAAMRQAVERQRDALDDVARSYDLNRDFHLAVVRGSANPYLMRFEEMLWVPSLGLLIYAAQVDDARRLSAWADDHERITDAIESGDADCAERIAREHILASPPVPP